MDCVSYNPSGMRSTNAADGSSVPMEFTDLGKLKRKTMLLAMMRSWVKKQVIAKLFRHGPARKFTEGMTYYHTWRVISCPRPANSPAGVCPISFAISWTFARSSRLIASPDVQQAYASHAFYDRV